MTGQLDVNIAVQRAGFHVDAAFAAAPGRTLALVGPNGAGKSTVLAAIAGLVPLASGSVRLGEQALDDLPPEHRRIGVVFQDFLLFPHLTVRDNVAFAARVAGAGRSAARDRAEPWLTRFDLTKLAERHPLELSGGQQQRVALARALAAEPQLLLLDEPMAALDVEVRDELRAELGRHLAGVQVATVVVTHDAADVDALAADVVVLEAGRVTQSGSVDDVRANPATAYVRRLFG